jgi:hypothetical protein
VIDLLNADFQLWNQGPSFTNPPGGTETADDWFASNFGGGSTGDYDQVAAGMRITNSGTTECGVAQTGTFDPILQGEFVHVSVTIARVSGTISMKFEGTFGNFFSSSPVFPLSGTSPVTYTADLFIGSDNTNFGIAIIVNGSAGVADISEIVINADYTLDIEDEQIMDDDTAHGPGINIAEGTALSETIRKTVALATLSEAVSSVDASTNSPQKNLSDVLIMSEDVQFRQALGPDDTLYLNEWVTVDRIPAGPWTNANG